MRLIAGMRQIAVHAGAVALGMIVVHTQAASTEAASTVIAAPAPGEASHAEIFGQLYGGTFASEGTSLSNGSITASRVDDANDELVSAGTYDVQAVAGFAQFNHTFGYKSGESGGSYEGVLSVSSNGYGVSSQVHRVQVDESFRWVRDGPGPAVSSRAADNADGQDHFVTYTVADQDERLLFIEDWIGRDTDWDFQDLVVRVTPVGDDNQTGEGGSHVAPTPTAVASGVALMIGATLLGRRRPRRR